MNHRSKGQLALKEIAIILAAAILINLTFVLVADFGTDIYCPSMPAVYNTSYGDFGNETVDVVQTLIDVSLNRCDGVPGWFFWLFQMPLIILLIYIGFVLVSQLLDALPIPFIGS